MGSSVDVFKSKKKLNYVCFVYHKSNHQLIKHKKNERFILIPDHIYASIANPALLSQNGLTPLLPCNRETQNTMELLAVHVDDGLVIFYKYAWSSCHHHGN